MPHLDAKTQELVIRVVYDGAPKSGRSTALADLVRALPFVPKASVGNGADQLLIYEWADAATGAWLDRRLKFQLVALPSSGGTPAWRRHLLETADALVFIVDSRPAELISAAPRLALAVRTAAHPVRAVPLALLVQANKQDLLGASSPEAVSALLALPAGTLSLPSIANKGQGVAEVFKTAVRLATDRAKALLLKQPLSTLAVEEGLQRTLETLPPNERDPAEAPEGDRRQVLMQAIEHIREKRHELELARAAKPATAATVPMPASSPTVPAPASPAASTGARSAGPQSPPKPLPAVPVAAAKPLPAVPAAAAKPLPAVPVTVEKPLPGVSAAAAKPLPAVPAAAAKPLPAMPAPTPVLSFIPRAERANAITRPEVLALPRPSEVISGHVWPSARGRGYLAQAMNGPQRVPAKVKRWAPAKPLELEGGGGWSMHSSPDWVFKSDEEGRAALMTRVRRFVALEDAVPDPRCLVLVPERDSWRLWLFTGPVLSLGEQTLALVERETVANLAAFCREALAAVSSLRERGVLASEVPAGAFGMALQQGRGRLLYLDEPATDAPVDRQDPIVDMFSILQESALKRSDVQAWLSSEGSKLFVPGPQLPKTVNR